MTSLEQQNITSVYNKYCHPTGARRLSDSFQPGKYDVQCARGKKAHNSEGNRRFRALVRMHQERYAACTCKQEKSRIVSHIVDTVRHASPNGGFVKLIDGHYWEAGDRAAKEKVGQTFRDILHTKYSSSTKAKARARMEKKVQNNEFTNMILPQHTSSIDQEDAQSQASDGASEDSSCDSSSTHSGRQSPDLSLMDTFDDDNTNEPQSPPSEDVLTTLRSSIHTIDPRVSFTTSLRGSVSSPSLRGSMLTVVKEEEHSRPSIINLNLLEPLARSISNGPHRSSMSPIPYNPHKGLKRSSMMMMTAQPRMSLIDATMMEPLDGAAANFEFTLDLDEAPKDKDLKDLFESMGMTF